MITVETKDVPQANSLSKVCDLLALVDSGIENESELMKELDLVRREIGYYKHAARILGFSAYGDGQFSISAKGHELLSSTTPEQVRRRLSGAVRSSELFQDLFSDCGNDQPSKAQVISFLLRRTQLNKTTASRRAASMLSWLKTIRQTTMGDE
jgi:hypothetical protein